MDARNGGPDDDDVLFLLPWKGAMVTLAYQS